MLAVFARCVACALVLISTGCTALAPRGHSADATVEGLLDDPAFRKENLPIRTLTIAILADRRLSEEVVRQALEDASRDLVMQVGVAIEVVGWRTEPLPNRDSAAVFRRLRTLCTRLPAHDIAIGITLEEGGDEEWEGDKRIIGRANHLFHSIHLRALGRHVIIHEIGHLLLGPLVNHSPTGVMHERASTPFFSVRDRALILQRKWGDFGACRASDPHRLSALSPMP